MSLYPLKKAAPRPPSNLARVPLGDKLVDHILGIYIQQHNNNNNENEDQQETVITWSTVVTACKKLIRQSSTSSSERLMHQLAHRLSQQFPSLPSDLKEHEKQRLIRHAANSSCYNNPQSGRSTSSTSSRHHPLDLSPRDLLSSRGAAMFPPLQKLTPRTSSSHESFRTKSSSKLLHDEEHYSPVKPPPPMILTHHYGKRNNESTRRKRNLASIHQAEVLALHLSLPQNRPVDVNEAVSQQQYQRSHSSGTNNKTSGGDANQNIKRRGIALNPNQLSMEEIEQILKSTTSADSKKERPAAVSSSRYGCYFTAAHNENSNNNSDDGHSSSIAVPHMSDEMMDRIRDRHRAMITKKDLDRAMQIRHQQLEMKKAEYQREVEREKQRSQELAQELEDDKNQKRQKKLHQKELADELKAAEKMRVEKQQADQREKQRYATVAIELNEKEKHDADVARAVQRHRREEAAKVNLMMASDKKKSRVQKRIQNQEWERQLLTVKNIATGNQ